MTLTDEPKREAAIQDGNLVYTSISAVNRHASCKRAYWFRYGPMRLPDPSGPAAQAGIEAHARLAAWVNTGVDTLTELERMGLPFIGERHPSLQAEAPVDGILYGAGVRFKGSMDLKEVSAQSVRVTDHKFKGQIGIEPQDLCDPAKPEGRQMIAYGRAAHLMHPEAAEIILRHLHYKTKGRAKVAEYLAPPLRVDSINSLWHDVCRDFVEPIKQTAKALSAEDVEPNLNACYLYHKPCPFMAQCPAHKAPSFAQLFGSTKPVTGATVGLLDQLNAAAAKPAEPIAAQPVYKIGGQYLVGGVAGELKEINGPIGRFLMDGGTPGSVWRDAALSTVEATPIAAAIGAEPVVAPAIAVEPAPKKQGRPKKVEAASVETAAAPAGNGIRLYLGCAPIGVQTQTLHKYVAETEAAILSTLEEVLPDMRLSGNELLTFGKWKAVLGQSVRKSLPPPGHYVVPGMPGEMLQVVADVLMGIADLVVAR